MRDVESVEIVPFQSKYEERESIDSFSRAIHPSRMQHTATQTTQKLSGTSIQQITDKMGEIWTSLMDPEVGVIGILGSRGVRKTAIMAYITFHLAETYIFDEIIWVTFPNGFSLEEIQNDIAMQVNVSLTACANRSSRTAKLLENLEKINKLLIIFDDIEEPISLEKVGIPHPKRNGGSKVVMTTHSRKVLHGMRVNKTIRIVALRTDEAWQLFVSRAGERVLRDTKIEHLARELVSQCMHVPILVTSLGHAMRNEFNIKEWMKVVEELSKNKNEKQRNLAVMGISYRQLTTDQVRTCFLHSYFSLADSFPEPKELIRYWIHKGFIDEEGDKVTQLNKGYEILRELLDADMLEKFTMRGQERLQMSYLFREFHAYQVGLLMHNLKLEHEDLIIKKTEIKEELGREEREQNRPKKEVLLWLQQVESVTVQVTSLSEKQRHSSVMCYEEFGDIRKEVDRLLKTGRFLEGLVILNSQFPDKPLLTAPELFGRTSEMIMGEIWKSLMEPEAWTIGIYGIGGVGKTAMMTNLNNQLATTDLFDKIIWVTSPKNFSLEKVQKDIAMQINVSLPSYENYSDRTARLLENIVKIEKCLIIFDDPWESITWHMDMARIFQLRKKHGSKVVVTTRSQEVLKRLMVNKSIKVDILPKEEAWDLFVSKAGDGVLTKEIQPLARKLVDQCNYIPILVISLGHVMRNEFNIKEWMKVSKELSESLSKIGYGEQKNLAVLGISYNRLTTDQVRTCFLYSSYITEDSFSKPEELIRGWIAKDFIHEEGDKVTQLIKGSEILQELLDAHMLEKFTVRGHERLQMHNLFRGFHVYLMNSEYEDLNSKYKDLIIKKTEIKEELKREEREQNRPKKEVVFWLQQVESITVQVTSLLEKQRHSSVMCYEECGDIRKEVDRLLKTGRFLEGLVILNSQFPDKPMLTAPELFGRTSEMIMGEIWKSLMDPGVGEIGIYGIGGVGKTSMMTNLNNQLATTDIFDKIIWVTLPKDFSLEKVQKDIAMQLNVSLPSYENHFDRTARLLENIVKIEKFLIIFDDLSESISSDMAWICQLQKNRGSKVVVTTRSRDVLERLRINKIIKVDVLPEEEAWGLFASKVGEGVLTDEKIKPLARKLVHECNYVPILVISLGHAMRNEFDIKEWRKAFTTMSKDKSGQSDHLKLLRISYSRLSTDSVRDCFVYCSFFPADCFLKPDELIRYWMAEGFISEEGDMVTQIDKGFEILRELHDANMLEKLTRRGHERLKMHDLFRDLANHLVKLDKDLFVQHGMHIFLPYGFKWPTCKKISLMGNHIILAIEEVGGDDTTTLLLRDNPLSYVFPLFSLGSCGLQVLDMSYTSIGTLSLGIGTELENLRVLFLQHCKSLELITSVRYLRSLQVLNLKGTAITHLPYGMKNLVKLRSLDLSETTKLQHIESGVLSSLHSLEELQLEGSNICKMDSPLVTNSLIEIRSLKRLAILSLSAVGFGDHLETIMCLKEQNLQRYTIKIYGSAEDVWEE